MMKFARMRPVQLKLVYDIRRAVTLPNITGRCTCAALSAKT